MAGLQKTIKALVSKEFAYRQGIPLGWESTLRWGLCGAVLTLMSLGLGILMPTVAVGVAALALGWVLLVLTLLVVLRNVGIRKRVILTFVIPVFVGYGLIHVVWHPPQSEILAAIRGIPEAVSNRIAPLLRQPGASGPASPSGEDAGARPRGTGQADLKLEFVGREQLQFRYFDDSLESANEPKRFFGLWDIDHPYYFDKYPGVVQPLPLTSKTEADFVFHGTKQGPVDVLDNYLISDHVKKGDRLFGVAYVSCLNCEKERSYWVYFKVGTGGWYAEMDKVLRGSAIVLPQVGATDEQVSSTLDAQVPPARRTRISEK